MAKGQHAKVPKKLYYVPFTCDGGFPPNTAIRGTGLGSVQIDIVFHQAQEFLNEIFFRASSGDRAAIKFLHQLTVEAVTHLHAVIRNQPGHVRNRACWWSVLPVLASAKEKNSEAIKQLMVRIGLGSKLGQAYSAKSRINFDLPVTRYAMAIKNTIEANQSVADVCRLLPELIPLLRYQLVEVAQWPQWVQTLSAMPRLHDLLRDEPTVVLSCFEDFWKVGKKAFLEVHPKPETIPELKPALSKSAAAPTVQRARLLWQIKQSLKSILRASAVPSLKRPSMT